MRKRLTWIAYATLAAACAALVASPTFASSHREAPLAAADPQIDATDLYAFVSPDKPDTVTLISNWIPFEAPSGGPNFYPWADDTNYDINIDNNGDARVDITYRWRFQSSYKNQDTFLYNVGAVNDLQDANLNFTQTYVLERIAGGQTQTLLTDLPSVPSNVGKASMPDYAKLFNQGIVPFSNGAGRSFAGQADDPFFLDLRLFDLLYGTDLKQTGNDTLNGYNVNVLAMQVPKTDLVAGSEPAIGIWTTASRPSTTVLGADGTKQQSGQQVQVARLGSPLVNEVVVPLQFKDFFNASQPAGDAAFLPKVQNPEVPQLLQKIYNINPPPTPRDDLVSIFLTGVEGLNKPANVTPSEQLRLNTSTPPTANPNRLGVIGKDNGGYPNGRRLSDDVVDIDLQVLAGGIGSPKSDLGDGVDANELPFQKQFPYVALPHSGSDTRAASSGSGGGGGDEPKGGAGTGAGGTAGDDTPVVPLTIAAVGIVLLGTGVVVRRRSRLQSQRARGSSH